MKHSCDAVHAALRHFCCSRGASTTLFKLQILYAEREFMGAQIKNANANNMALSKEMAHLKSQLAAVPMSAAIGPSQEVPEGQLHEALLSRSSSSGSISNDIFADANR